MGTSELLTVLAILVAGYSLLSDERRLDIQLRFSWFERIFTGLFLFIILLVIYSPVIVSVSNIKPIPWFYGFNENIMIFSCLLVIIVFFVYKMLGHRLPKTRYEQWSNASEQYLRSKKFEQLGYLFNKYHQQLFREIFNQTKDVDSQNYLIYQAIFDSLEKKTNFLENLLPKPDKKRHIVQLTVSRILKSSTFVAHLAETYPLVGAKATCLSFKGVDEFETSFFESLISHPRSPLYRELRDNQSSSYTGEYYIDESNSLLSFYLKDISVAQQVHIWKPIGEYVITFINKQRGRDNYYNQPDNNYPYSNERWESPIFVGISFFNIMISQAIFQRSKDHMWLSYYDKFLKKILENLEYPPNINKQTEFPTRFNYIIFELFTNCDSWVSSVNYLDYNDWSNEDIINSPEYWAAKTLGNMLYQIIMSNKLSDAQKVYLLEIAIRRMEYLDKAKHFKYSQLIFKNCTCPFITVESETVKELNRLYQQVDHVLKSRDSTFEIELSKLTI